MTVPYLGGFTITGYQWIDSSSLKVSYSTTYGSLYYYQMYVGRGLVGVSDNPSDLSVIGVFSPTLWPQHIWLLAVDGTNKLTDYGTSLPVRPFNKVKFDFTVADTDSDSKYIDIVGGTVVGGAVSQTNLLARIEFEGAGSYSYVTDPIQGGTGTWNFELSQRDNRNSDSISFPGNEGTAAAVSEDLIMYPPDFSLLTGGNRFTASSTTSTITAEIVYPV